MIAQLPWKAYQVLDAVERWAYECYLLRETAALGSGESRMDGLLFPRSFDAQCPLSRNRGLYGVEVKVTRSDFQRGLREGQFGRYGKMVNGLYIATGKDVCKTSEIPAEYGHLVVYRRQGCESFVAVCKRKAKYRQIEDWRPEIMWHVVFDLMDQCQREARAAKERYEKASRKLGTLIGDTVMQVAANIEKQTEVQRSRP